MFFQAYTYMTGNYTCNYMHMHRNVYFQAFAFISQGCICNYIIEQGISLCWNLQAHVYTMACVLDVLRCMLNNLSSCREISHYQFLGFLEDY